MDNKKIIEIAVKAAMEYMEEQKEKEKHFLKNKRLHNTRLLLQNYWLFKSHCEKSIYKLSESIDPSKAIDILDIIDRYDDKAFVSAIKQSVTRTHIILAHIDEMLKLYKIYCDNSEKEEDKRRYRVVCAFFFENAKKAEIAEREGIEERTVQRDVRDACYKLGALIFGLDSLDSVS